MEVKNKPVQGNDFFISFSNKDLPIVSQIVDILTNTYHASCWFQEKDSKAEFIDAIMDGIENAKAFLVFLSPESANSNFVLNEVNHALNCKQENDDYQVLPIMIDQDIQDLADPCYRRIRFYLGRLNILFSSHYSSLDHLVLKIFEQTGFEIQNETIANSLYYVSESEARRLQSQNEIMKEFSKDFFSTVVKPDFAILDVGCADATAIMSRLDGYTYQSFLGIDKDASLIQKAIKSYESENRTFLCCDALSDKIDIVLSDYLENLDLMGFDLIHVSALLLHLEEPVRLLRLLRRYLKKNGHLFIQEEDDGANIVHPYSRFYDLAFRIWADSKESGDRHCARKIPSYLSQAGFSKIQRIHCGVSNAVLPQEQKEALWDIYFNYHLWLAADENMFYHPKETNILLEEYKTLYEIYKKQYDADETFVQLGFYFFSAQK